MRELFIWLTVIFFFVFCFRGLFLLMMMDTMFFPRTRSWWWLLFWLVLALTCGTVAANISG